MNIKKELERLSQNDFLEGMRRSRHLHEMITVYQQDNNEGIHSHNIHCALIPVHLLDKTLSDAGWEFHYREGFPGSVKYGNGLVEYLRFGRTDGIEPLVIGQSHDETDEDNLEISEEFRHFHRLRSNGRKDQYFKIDENGDKKVVLIKKPNLVNIRLKEIRQYLAIKEMYLSIQFDCCEHSANTWDELGLIETAKEHRDDFCCWRLNYADREVIGERGVSSRILGKRLIEPLPKSKSGLWGFSEEIEMYEDFILGIDDNGDEIINTCNPALLADFFGSNSDAPNYLTSISFEKCVLDRYYQQPSKYEVSSSFLRCGSSWGICIDNHHDDKVCAWLGDLGRDLPYKEQKHWKVHNFASETGPSRTYIRQQLLAQPTDSDRPEHLFQRSYGALQKVCDVDLGWYLLRPLASKDRFHLQNIRVPSTDEQHEFDQLVLGLTKILIDSINEKKLVSLLKQENDIPTGGISRLEFVLITCGAPNVSEHIGFLRNLQKLRSTGSAHRKGKNYNEAISHFGDDTHELATVFEGLLLQSVSFLDYLTNLVKQKSFAQESGK